MEPNELPTESDAFWQLYLQEHSSACNRWLHVSGTLASVGLVALAICMRNAWYLVAASLIGYGLAWFGHAFVERNRPLSLRSPWRSFKCDYRLTYLMLVNGGMIHRQKDDVGKHRI